MARVGPSRPPGSGMAWRVFGAAFAVLVLLFLMLPILAIVPLSVNGGSFLHYPLQGVSTRWYIDMVENGRWMTGLRNSFIVGIPATIIATVLGTMAAVGLNTARFRMKSLMVAVLLSPMIVPVVTTSVGVYFFFARFGLNNSFLGLILAHAALGCPFVVITVNATLQGYDRTLTRAAASLGADPLTAFRRVTLPLILPGVVAGALFAFVTSFDEVVVALLVAGPEQQTLPRVMFSGIRENISPTITAVATVLIAISTLLLVVLEILRRRSERLRAGRPS